ncbi:MAG: hypothetical protein ACRDYB_00125, partial [Acidimicrobiales bacterium]
SRVDASARGADSYVVSTADFSWPPAQTSHDHNCGLFGGHGHPSDIDLYPYEFLEQVLWAMNQTTVGIIETVSQFASGKDEASSR